MNLNTTTFRLFNISAMALAPLATVAQLAFYGTTNSNTGGPDMYGGIFRYVPQTNTFTSEHVCSATDGSMISGMVQMGDLFYGTTSTEGATGFGSVFSFDPATSNYTVLANFDSINGKGPVDDMVLAPDGKFYGVTSYGGTNNGGVLYSFNPTNNTITKLHDFLPGPYSQPMAGPILGNNGNLYGVVSFYYGGLFEYNIGTDAFNYIFDFPTTNGGRVPYGKLTEVQDSVFYGSTRYGGTGTAQSGTLFRYDQRDDSFTTVKFFQDGADGAWPQNGFVHVGDNIYGFAYKGGAHTYGIFFKYDVVQQQYTKLVDLDYPVATYPENRPILGSDGKIYSAIKSGGSLASGSLVKYDIATGALTSIYSFSSGSGNYPFNGIIETCITPPPTGATSLVLCEGATVANLSATGQQVKWYDAANATTQLTSNTPLSNGTYYASQTIECPSSERLAVDVTIQNAPDVGVTVNGLTMTVNESGAQYQWINCATNANIPGATSQSFTATANGQYKVRVTVAPCVQTSTCTSITGIGLNEMDMSGIKVYPNPVLKDVTIEYLPSLRTIELLDVSGNLISVHNAANSRTLISLAELSAGSYVLRFTDTKGNTGQQTVVKQ